MWCSHCQQDVPAVAAAGDGRVQCARCQRPVARAAFPSGGGADGSVDATNAAASPADGFSAPRRLDADERYRRIGRTLRSAQRRAAPAKADGRMLRLDVAEASPLTRQAARPLRPVATTPATQSAPRDQHRASQTIAWLITLTGAAVLGAGIGLIGWSLVGERPFLWDWGLFGTFAGQGLLVVGLTLLLANLWTNARLATGRLASLQNEVIKLQRSTEALTGDRTATATRFYADLARGASPELLVANLRGQLDELSASLAAD